jgi:hypothetical protein
VDFLLELSDQALFHRPGRMVPQCYACHP